jgi:type IV secretory pathway TrbD component
MSSTSDMPLPARAERRQRDRRQFIRRGQDRNRVDERNQMAVVVYVGAMAIAAAGFGIGMWAGWFVWGGP